MFAIFFQEMKNTVNTLAGITTDGIKVQSCPDTKQDQRNNAWVGEGREEEEEEATR
jgi:hypothetical protein